MKEDLDKFGDNISEILVLANQLEALFKLIQDGIYYQSEESCNNSDIACALEVFKKEFEELVNNIDELDLKYYRIKNIYLGNL